MDPTKGDAKSEEEEEEEEEHMRKPLSEKERKANDEGETRKESKSFSSNSTSSDDDDDGDSPEDLFQLDINKSPAASGRELRRLQSGAQTNPFSSLIDDEEDVVTTPDRPRRETDAPDPDRIHPSVFTGTSSNSPTHWSAASNESLFSIQGGNSSFSKDHASLSGRSGGQSPCPPSPQPPPSLGSNAATVEARREELEEAADAKASSKDAVLQEHSEGQRQSEEQRRRSSDSSAKSYQSFAFPILTGEGRNSSAKAESAHLLRPANKPQQQPQPETQLPKSSSSSATAAAAAASASPPPVAAAASPPPPAASAPKSKWLACCRCPSFC